MPSPPLLRGSVDAVLARIRLNCNRSASASLGTSRMALVVVQMASSARLAVGAAIEEGTVLHRFGVGVCCVTLTLTCMLALSP